MDSSRTRMAVAIIVALTIHLFILRSNPEWRLAAIPWSEREESGITVRIVSGPAVFDQEHGPAEPGPAAADKAMQSQPEISMVPQVSGNRPLQSAPPLIRPGPVRKKTAEVLAAGEVADKPLPLRLEPVVRPRAASGLPEEKNGGRQQEEPGTGRAVPETMAAPAAGVVERASSSPVIRTATPLYRMNPPPAYPALARKRGYEGITTLRVLVNETGSVDTLAVATSSGYELLDQAALQAVAKWSFAPATSNGRPMAMLVMVPVRFDLK